MFLFLFFSLGFKISEEVYVFLFGFWWIWVGVVRVGWWWWRLGRHYCWCWWCCVCEFLKENNTTRRIDPLPDAGIVRRIDAGVLNFKLLFISLLVLLFSAVAFLHFKDVNFDVGL